MTAFYYSATLFELFQRQLSEFSASDNGILHYAFYMKADVEFQHEKNFLTVSFFPSILTSLKLQLFSPFSFTCLMCTMSALLLFFFIKLYKEEYLQLI